jgi:hypothetical protein
VCDGGASAAEHPADEPRHQSESRGGRSVAQANV